MAHKGAESFSLITNMITQHIRSVHASIALVIFSCMTPIGIIIGKNLLDMRIAETNYLIQPYFDAMAAGTFIYVALVCNPYHAKKTSLLSAVLAISGFAIMSILSVYI